MSSTGNRAGHLFMTFESTIEQAIVEESEKLIQRFQSYHNQLELDYRRELSRISNPPPKEVQVPEYWTNDKKFNPFYVAKHAHSISRSIVRKIRLGTYRPLPPASWEIEKPSGGTRTITVFQIPDAAVSNLLYQQLLAKNRHRFSAYAYAYRDDRNAQFAVQDISVDVKNYSRLFICELDFSDFFGSISHNFLFSQFSRNGFLVSADETRLIQAFLSYQGGQRGIPQGTSVSLFLANLACWELDASLEREGVKFARYADDTVIWTNDYSRICRAFDFVSTFSRSTGIKINPKKSDGISLLTRSGHKSEWHQVKNFIEFLGYRVSVDGIGIRQKSVQKIKKRLSYLIYRNLIQPLRQRELTSFVMPSNNRDEALLTAISQVRRYLYGNLSERQIFRYIKGHTRRLQFKGLMSYYPLLDDEEQLKALDGWLLAVLNRSVKLRSDLLLERGFDVRQQFPFNAVGDGLLNACREQLVSGKRLYKIPSLLRIYRAIKQGVITGGIVATMNPRARRYPSDPP
jgi:RNA-directed DNA polymerase